MVDWLKAREAATRRQRGQRDCIELVGQTSYVRFQYTPKRRASIVACGGAVPGPEFNESLHTKSRAEADVLAQPHVLRHKHDLLTHAVRSDPNRHLADLKRSWLEGPGTDRIDPDGARVTAGHLEITYRSPDGKVEHLPNTPSKKSFSAPRRESFRPTRIGSSSAGKLTRALHVVRDGRAVE